MKLKYYAIRKGHTTGVYFGTWEQVKPKVKGFAGAEYKSFSDVYEAQQYFLEEEYNMNKTFGNLGLSPLFATTASDVNPVVINGLSTSTSNHDFFSQVGNGYLLGEVEPIKALDFNMLDNLVKGVDTY